MKACPTCSKPFKPWKPSRFAQDGGQKVPDLVLIPDCQCFKNKAEAEYQAHLKDERQIRAIERYKHLLFNGEPVVADLKVPHEGWEEDPSAMILDGAKLIIYGPTGTGKSEAIKALCLRLCLAGVKVRGGYLQKVLDSLKDLDNIIERMESLMSGHVLVLDDLDKPTMTKYEVDRLLALIDHYDTPGRAILASLNVDMPTLEKKLSSYDSGDSAKQKASAIVSRLQNRAILIKQDKKMEDRRVISELIVEKAGA